MLISVRECLQEEARGDNRLVRSAGGTCIGGREDLVFFYLLLKMQISMVYGGGWYLGV